MAKLLRWSARLGVKYASISATTMMSKLHSKIPLTSRILPVNWSQYTGSHVQLSTCRTLYKGTNLPDTGIEVTILDGEGQSLGHMTLAEAETLAKNAEQELVLVTKKDREDNSDVYKLEKVTHKKKKDKMKVQKIHSTIDDHDLAVKVKKLVGWMEKGHDVQVKIEIIKGKKGDRVFKEICKAVETHGRVPKAQTTPHEIIMNIVSKDKVTKSGEKAPQLLKQSELKSKR